ncbi:MAG: biotin--[acetyl-CoA-carboxylase] ligase [Verrucomicrobiota bacterium]
MKNSREPAKPRKEDGEVDSSSELRAFASSREQKLSTARHIAREILVFDEIGSTNDETARLARAGAESGLAVFAERQTAGRGRFARRWESAARKGLWFSLLLRPELPLTDWPRLATWAAVGIARGLEEALPSCCASIKWPNDVYLLGRKASGILIETAVGENSFAVVGIGVNVNHAREDFPEELADKAISLRGAAGADAPDFDRQLVAAALLRNLDALYPALVGDFSPVIAEAESRSLLLGQWIEVAGAAEPIQGVVEGLEPDGSLRLRGAEGQVQVVSGGEVTVSKWDRDIG